MGLNKRSPGGRVNLLLFPMCFALWPILLAPVASAQTSEDPAEQIRSVVSTPWPHPIPCRIQDGSDHDLFVMVLGEVNTPLAEGVFNPINDEVLLRDGRRISSYFKEHLGIKYFKAMDKSVFPLPPSGWCSWYYYYKEINEDEVRTNALWITENLRDYGATVVQIDDGWQGAVPGPASYRDWTTTSKRFPRGMADLASYIRDLGLTPGIWLAPHGQSNEEVVGRNPGVFLLGPDGISASDTWEGKYLVDPTSEAGRGYMRDLFATLCNWGYDYFKIDGQPIVVREYEAKRAFFGNKKVLGNNEALYRRTIETIRSTIGPRRFLLGCWGIPLEGMGMMNGCRTGGDIVLGWDGFRVALNATMRYYFLHNIAWYCDPDVLVVRSPLPLEQARVWATLQGLTGQALLISDRLGDLSGDRVEILKAVYPAVDIRPLDLFPSNTSKRVWDLKVSHLGRSYDVVGVFNWDEEKKEYRQLQWKELGLPEDRPIHVFDFWNKDYLGAWENGMSLEVAPASCRVLTLVPASDRIELVSTSRHITQGWIDLVSLTRDEQGLVFSGRSRVIGGDPYALRFAFPRGKNFRTIAVTAAGCRTLISDHQGWVEITLHPQNTGEVEWQITFAPAALYAFPCRAPEGLTLAPVGVDGALLRWRSQYYLNAGYRVYLNGRLAGFTPTNSFILRNLDPAAPSVVEVESVWEDGKASEKKAALSFTLKEHLSDVLDLSELDPIPASKDPGHMRRDRSLVGSPISIRDKRYAKGIGTSAPSRFEFDLAGQYAVFSAVVGLDDISRGEMGWAEFVVFGDGKELWRSGKMTRAEAAKPIETDIQGVNRLNLVVLGPEEGEDFVAADWASARVSRGTKPAAH